MIEKNQNENPERIIFNLNTLQRKKDSPVTYVHLDGVIAVPSVLVEHLTRRELFIFLKSRGIVGFSSGLNLEFSSKNF